MLWTIGGQMQLVALSYYVYTNTGEALNLGYIGLFLFLPAISFSLLTGAVADRFDRRAIVMVCQCTMVLASLALFYITGRPGHALWPIYAVLFVTGTAMAFATPASQSLLPLLVPAKHFPNAVVWNSTIWQVATVVGPGAGGMLVAHLGAPRVFLIDASMTTGAFCCYLFMKIRTGRMEKSAVNWKSVTAGIHFIFQRKAVLGAISLDLFAVLFGGATALMPVFATDILHVGAVGFGWLRAAPSVGAAITAMAMAYVPPIRRAGATMFWCVAAFGACTIVFGLSRIYLLSFAVLVILGAVDMISVIIRHTLVTVMTPPSMQGRVSAVNSVFIGASNELGEFESGLTAHWFGAVRAVVLGGIGTLMVTGLWARLFPTLRQYGRLDQQHTHDLDEPRNTEPS
ncbi:MFS transporter [soil metagenome]